MCAFLASALLPLRRTLLGERVGPPAALPPKRVFPLALVAAASIPEPMMSSEPSPLSKTLEAMLKVLKRYVLPPFLQPPLPPPLPPPSVLLNSVVERTVGLGSRVGTDLRGPFSVAALKGLRAEAVVRYEVWDHTPAEVTQDVEALISNLLGDRDRLRAEGFLLIALKSTAPSENIFAEEAWRQTVEFSVLFEFPYVDSDGADSLIARIPINLVGEVNESTLVVDEMARWDNESAPDLLLRGRLTIDVLAALAFVPGASPGGKVTITRTFDGAAGPPTGHATLTSFVVNVGGDTPAERHAQVVFPSLAKFLAAIASFKITDEALVGMKADLVPPNILTALALDGTKDKEVGGEDEFVAFLETRIGAPDTAAFKTLILKNAGTSKPVTMGDWDKDDIPDVYRSLQFRVIPAIQLTDVSDRLEVTYQDPKFNEVAILYLRAARGLTT